jgi:hypothetical protein
MKLILSFILMSWGVFAQDVYERGQYVPPVSIFDVKDLNPVLFSEAQSQELDLKKVKYFLINGEMGAAKVVLNKIGMTPTKLKPVALRYMALLSFLENNHLKAYEYLKRPELNSIPQFSKICTVKVLNLIILNKTYDIEDQWNRCQVENAGRFKDSHLVWVDTLVELKMNPKGSKWKVPYKKFSIAAFHNEDLKAFLKLGLFLKQDELLAKNLVDLTVEQLQDLEIRELAAQIFYRSGSLVNSYKFVDGLNSPNAENIKGNLYLLRTKYELAYAQFRLALEKKQNSQNALERLIPLAWILGDWENGAIYAERMIADSKRHVNKLTLAAAFYMQKGDYEKTNLLVNSINQTSRLGREKDVAQLGSFVGLMKNDVRALERNGLLSCQGYDLVNCWIIYQTAQWDSFPLTIRRDEAIFKEENLWAKVKDDDLKPLTETVYINQIDIEELDDKLYGTNSKAP